jgi:hypothetical protein
MVVTVKVQPIDRDLIITLVAGTPEQRSAIFAEFARKKLAEGEEQDKQVLGQVPPHKTFVDGSEGASEDNVKPDGGIIVYEFEIVSDALIWISEQLQQHSPVGSGRDPHPGLYQRSHVLFADGNEVPMGSTIPPASEYEFVNIVPYAVKIEHGSSPQFPDGVYEAVAALARARFGNSAKIEFNYRALLGSSVASPVPLKNTSAARAANKSDVRQPSIIITPR